MTETIRTRFAPSPTGELHLGNARAALFAWLFARSQGGVMALRIEDTDRNRSKPEFEASMMDDLKWLGLDWDEGPDVGGPYGPYRQSEREEIYAKYVNRLKELGKLYPCFCTPEELEADRIEQQKAGHGPRYGGKCRGLTEDEAQKKIDAGEPHTLRFRVPDGESFTVHDLIRGETTFEADHIGDFVLARSNGLPIFLLTNLVDDIEMKITHAVRGEDHLSNAPRQIMIAKALGAEAPIYAHATLILGPDKKKFSKRHGSASVDALRADGYVPAAVVNYLALLGWNPKDEREFFSLAELKEAFSFEAVGKSAATFDFDKFNWMNSHYLRELPLEEQARLCAAELHKAGLLKTPPEELSAQEKKRVARMTQVAGDRVRLPRDIVPNADFYFLDVAEYDPKGAKKHLAKEDAIGHLKAISEALLAIPCEKYSEPEIEAAMRSLAESRGVGLGALNHPARLALTGRTIGPGLFEIMEILGAEACAGRIAKAIAYIETELKGGAPEGDENVSG